MIVSPALTGQDPTNINRVPEEQAKQSAPSQDNSLDPNRPDLLKFVLSLIEQIRADGKQERIRRLRKWVRNAQFYEGNQYGYISPYTGRWVDIDVSEVNPSQDDDDDLQFVNNQFRFYTKSVKKEWTRSQTHLRVGARSDKAEKIGAAEFASDILFDKQRNLLTEDKKQAESSFALLSGNYFRYSYYSTDVFGAVERVPLFESTVVKMGPDVWSCNACGAGGEQSELQLDALSQAGSIDNTYSQQPAQQPTSACPVCNNPEVTLEEGPSFEGQIPTGEYQEYKVGDAYTEIVNPMEVNVHLHARNIAQTPYLHRERLITRAVLKQKFQNAQLKGGTWQGTVGASSMIRAMEISNGNSGGGSSYGQSGTTNSNSPFELLQFDQIWIDVPVYADYVTKQDENISDGTTIPANTALKDKFPRGMYIAVVGNEILNIRNENKSDHWVHGVFDLIPTRFFGDGLEDMVELQRQLNEVINLRFENMMANAAPNTIFNPQKIDPEGFSGKPREMNALINASADDDIRKFVYRLEGTGLDRENFSAEENYKKDMQTLSGAFSINSGMPDVDISTATGARIVRDAAISMIGPALAIKAKVDVEWAYQVLKLVQSYWTNERYVPRAGNHTKQTGQWFRAADVTGDFEITYVPGSWMPRSETEEREDFLSFISPQATGLPLGFLNPMIPEPVRAYAAEKYRIEIDLDSNRVHARIAQGRIDNLLKAANDLISHGLLDPSFDFQATQQGMMPPPGMSPGMPPPQAQPQPGPSTPGKQLEPDAILTGQQPEQPAPIVDPNVMAFQLLLQQVPVRLVVDEHMVFINTYRQWLATDDGIDAPKPVQTVLEMKIAEHYLAGAQVQGYLAGLTSLMQGISSLPGMNMPTSQPGTGPQPGPGIAPPVSPTSQLQPGANTAANLQTPQASNLSTPTAQQLR